jgi:peroxiredoxin
MPYAWLNYVLVSLGISALLGAIAFVTAAVIRGRGKRKKPLFAAGFCLGGFLLFAAANFALIFVVQLPSLGRERRQARQEYVEAISSAKLNERAPSFRIKTLSGSDFAPAELGGKVVLLYFFATWCEPCIKELPHIEELWKQYGERKDFALLAIGREESEYAVSAFLAKHGYSFPAAADPERSVYALYADDLIPRTYLIGREGTICYATTGFYVDEVESLKQEVARRLRLSD